ncbi:MAG: RNA 2',3'-cyclic phosphodiesterase [Candidatus Kerfeldbacteria bacterium]|nr:RNA 2',3'-cyclic phosphodiesterase [Candidatus Kerfeldbacteria bacterium]
MRLFIGLELPPALRLEIERLKTSFESLGYIRGKWVEVYNLHLTLGFLGEVGEELLTKLTYSLEQVAATVPAFKTKLTGLVGIPPRQPRILALASDAKGSFYALQQKLTLACSKVGLNLSAKATHLTLVRLKVPLYKMPPSAWKPADLFVAQFSLMQSTLTPKGPVYKPLRAFKLALGAQQTKFRPSVAVCVINPQNEVILIWRSENRPHDLGFPQGGINPGETAEAAAKRELKEELGLEQVTVLGVRDRIYTYRWPKGLIKYGKDADKRGYLGQEQSLVIVRLKELRPELKPDPLEAAVVRWVPLDKLLASLKPKRRALGRLVMVELNKLGISPKP